MITRAVGDRIPIRIWTPDPDYGSGLLLKFNRDFLVQGYICVKNFHENPITLSGDVSKVIEKCPVSQC